MPKGVRRSWLYDRRLLARAGAALKAPCRERAVLIEHPYWRLCLLSSLLPAPTTSSTMIETQTGRRAGITFTARRYAGEGDTATTAVILTELARNSSSVVSLRRASLQSLHDNMHAPGTRHTYLPAYVRLVNGRAVSRSSETTLRTVSNVCRSQSQRELSLLVKRSIVRIPCTVNQS